MSLVRLHRIALAAFLLSVPSVPSLIAQSSDWLPIKHEELVLKEDSATPSLHAMILYYEHEENDRKRLLVEYFRIKIFSEEGKKYANVESKPYLPKHSTVESIRARCIHTDGSIIDFNGQVFERTISRGRDQILAVKTFTIPDVQIGSIIEYKITTHWNSLRHPRFVVQHDLPMLKGHYHLVPDSNARLAWISINVNPRFQPRQMENREIFMDIERVPGFEKEDLAPPEEEVRARVQFFYAYWSVPNVYEYWNWANESWSKEVESFMDKHSAMQGEVASIVSPADAPELKLRKIYERVQKIRNLTYQRTKTRQEEKREFGPNKNVKDVLVHGYGYDDELSRLFTALARAAGLNASVMRVAERNSNYFHREIMDDRQLGAEISTVKLDGKLMYFAPGMPYCPFGTLPWEDSATSGYQLGVIFGEQMTPAPVASENLLTRRVTAVLDASGNLSGQLEISITGQRALHLRLDAREKDTLGRQKIIKALINEWLPKGSSTELKSVEDWESSSLPLSVSVEISVPGFASRTGKRLLIPVTLFSDPARNLLLRPYRNYPIHFDYPRVEHDEIRITLPSGTSVDSLPMPRQNFYVHGTYRVIAEQQGNTLALTRHFELNSLFVPAEQYQGLRRLFESAKLGDADQAVFKVALNP